MADVRQKVMSTSAGLQLSVVDEAIDQWHERLDAGVRAQGGHFEQSWFWSVSSNVLQGCRAMHTVL